MTASATEQAPRRPDTLRLLTAFGSPIALGTTLMLYFGWVRSEAQARAFGADASVFAMSGQDLVMRSVDILFVPGILLMLFGLLAMRVDPWLHAHARTIVPILRFAWVLAPIGLAVRAATGEVGDAVLPLWVFAAVGGTAYSGRLRRQAVGEHQPPRVAQVVIVVLLLTVILFWQTERWAQLSGRALADDIKSNMHDVLEAVTVFSAVRLPTDAGSIVETRMEGENGAFVYRYDGLYLLQRSGDKYFLLSDGWSVGEGRLIVVPDTDTVRLEFGA
jgi:hypothetical protein